MGDSETTSESWLSRLMGSITSVLAGMVLFVVAFPLLFWNEGRAVQTARSLAEGAGAVVSVAASSVETANEGKLVHVNGEATTTETLADPELGVSAAAIKLLRVVEMFQWSQEEKSETQKKLGGGTETVKTYDYTTKWSSQAIDSSGFKKREGHENPTSLPFPEKTLVASKVTLGGFDLPESVVTRLDRTDDINVDEKVASALPAALQGKLTVAGGGYYSGKNPSAPTVGDVRIKFKAVRPAAVSLVARQVGHSFEAYQAKAGKSILLLKYGTLTADAMFQAAQQENTILTWILRGVGFLLMFFGLMMMGSPIVVFADVIPLFGTVLGAGIGVFAGLSAFVFWLFTIALSWVFFRPLLGIALGAVAVAALVTLVRIGLKRREERGGQARRRTV